MLKGCLDKQHSTNQEWCEAGGGIQSLGFYFPLINEIFKLDHVETICDYGCGMGDGIALVQAAFPESLCYGYDTDADRISKATMRWPTIPFYTRDLLHADQFVDVNLCVHTMEHVPDPIGATKHLQSLCKTLIVVYPPIGEMRGGHSEDAMTDEEYIQHMEPDTLSFKNYLTQRRYSHNEPLMVEGNNLLVLRGDLS